MHSGSNHTAFGNRIHNIGNFATDSGNASDAIFVSTANDIIDSNVMTGIGRTACISSCSLHNDQVIYDDPAGGATGTIIRNNLFYNNTHGFQIQLFSGSMANIQIINNTMDATAPPSNGAIGCIVQGVALSNSRISGNICTHPNGGVMISTGCCGDSASNVVVDHNVTDANAVVVVNNGYSIDTTNVLNANSSVMYNNFGANDFSLTSSSPALGKADGTIAPPLDIDGTSRPQNGRFDAGAYEFPH